MRQRASAGRTALATDDGDTDAWTRFVREEMVDRPTQAVAIPQGEESYLTDLRRSMDSPDAGDADSEGRASKGRFGRRR